MTIIFNYLFTATGDGFKTRVPLRLQQGPVFAPGMPLSRTDLDGLDLHQWEGKAIEVSIQEAIYTIKGLAE
ncbi:hypothetical protein ACAW74_00995 [Fibrella sp. WM1]|uniref:hypothetical protein n=1 Tax=Fibrella musci TaxID=3242485 RepID=UPI00352147B9